MLNHDRLNSMPIDVAGQAAMQVIDTLQRYPREAQVLGSAAVFVLLCERFGINVQDVMTVTSNLMHHAEGRRPEFAAVTEYLAREL